MKTCRYSRLSTVLKVQTNDKLILGRNNNFRLD